MSQAERLFVLTLALEESVLEEDWPTVFRLLEERGALLDQLTGLQLRGEDLRYIEKAEVVQQRCLVLLNSRRRDIVNLLSDSLAIRKAISAYGQGPIPNSGFGH
jgi:hypothetical protein